MERAPGSRYWAGVVGYVVVLLSAQSFMGLGIDKFKELWGLPALEVTAYSIVALGAAAVVWWGSKAWSRCTPVERAWIAVALTLYGAGTLSARNPQERLHYLGYGALAILLFFGFFGRAAGGGALGAALLALVAGSIVGWVDELLQILWPRRYFDWADVAINVLAVGLGLLVAAPMGRALRRGGEDPSHRG